MRIMMDKWRRLKTFYLKVESDDGEFCYQGIKLAKCELTIKRAKTVYASAISDICTKVEQRFSSFVDSATFSNILLLFDSKSWPKDYFISSIARSTSWQNIIWHFLKKMDVM